MDHSAQAREKRELAVRARRYASVVTQDADRQRLLKWAVELDEEATRLEEGDGGGNNDADKRRSQAQRHDSTRH